MSGRGTLLIAILLSPSSRRLVTDAKIGNIINGVILVKIAGIIGTIVPLCNLLTSNVNQDEKILEKSVLLTMCYPILELPTHRIFQAQSLYPVLKSTHVETISKQMRKCRWWYPVPPTTVSIMPMRKYKRKCTILLMENRHPGQEQGQYHSHPEARSIKMRKNPNVKCVNHSLNHRI